MLVPYTPVAVEGALTQDDANIASALLEDPDLATTLAPTQNLDALVAAQPAAATKA